PLSRCAAASTSAAVGSPGLLDGPVIGRDRTPARRPRQARRDALRAAPVPEQLGDDGAALRQNLLAVLEALAIPVPADRAVVVALGIDQTGLEDGRDFRDAVLESVIAALERHGSIRLSIRHRTLPMALRRRLQTGSIRRRYSLGSCRNCKRLDKRGG